MKKTSTTHKKDRKGGILAGLFAPAGRQGGASSVVGAGAVTGGLAATKAGIVTLALIGTTVAGGIGYVGYSYLDTTGAFAPSAPSQGEEGLRFSSLFKPKESAPAPQEKPVSADGRSDSLQFLSQANQGSGASLDGGESLRADQSLRTQTADASAPAPQSPLMHAPIGPGVPAGPAGKTGLKSDKKFGELSKMVGSSGGAPAAGKGGAEFAGAPAQFTPGRSGTLSSMPGAASRAGGNRRAITSAYGSGSAGKQLLAVRKDHYGATSSPQSGRTYDGGGTIVGDATVDAAGVDATGTDAGTGEAEMAPNAEGTQQNQPPPTTTKPRNVTPWQKALDQAKILLAAAMALMFLAGKFADMAKTSTVPPALAGAWLVAAQVAAGLAAVAALGAFAIGAQIAFGKPPAPLPGWAFMLGGAATAAAAVPIVFGGSQIEAENVKAVTGFMEIATYAAAAALAVGFMGKAKKKECKTEKECDKLENKGKLWGSRAPSETALERFLA